MISIGLITCFSLLHRMHITTRSFACSLSDSFPRRNHSFPFLMTVFTSVFEGDFQTLLRSIEEDPSILKSVDPEGRTLLHWACMSILFLHFSKWKAWTHCWISSLCLCFGSYWPDRKDWMSMRKMTRIGLRWWLLWAWEIWIFVVCSCLHMQIQIYQTTPSKHPFITLHPRTVPKYAWIIWHVLDCSSVDWSRRSNRFKG